MASHLRQNVSLLRYRSYSYVKEKRQEVLIKLERKHIFRLLAVLCFLALVPILAYPAGMEPVPEVAAAPLQAEVFDPRGPFADKVIYHVIEGQDVQVAALVQGEIDHLADNVDASYIEELQANPDIEVTQTERLGFGFTAINCQRYPYTYPELRRAMALAADKHEVATIMWGGLGFALDSMVPASTGAWHNNATTPSYKSPQVEAAKAELASAGFVDLDLDGYVEAPNGEPFQFRPMWSISAPQWGAAMQSQTVYWDQAGINVQDYPVTFNTLLDLVSTIPRNYEGACFALNIDPEPTYISIWTTEQITNPEGNRANWSNASYDAQIDIFSTSSDYDAVLDACHLAQQIHVEQVPYLIWYSNWEVNAHRTDKWEGFQVSPGWGTASSNRWPPRQVRLKEGQPERDATTGTGGTFHTLIATSMDTQNNLMGTSAYGLTILAQVYQGLTDTNPLTHTVEKYMNALSYDWTQTELADGLQFDFKIYTNATWHDGVPVTAEDIKFSYDYNYNYSIPTYAIAHTYFNSCSIIDEETVRITTNGKSYWAFDYVRSWDIIPKHIWEGIVSPTTFTNPLPIGSGWFKWVRRVEGEFVELDFWELFHRGVPGHTAPEVTPVSYLWVYIAVGVVVIVVVLLGSVWYLRKK